MIRSRPLRLPFLARETDRIALLAAAILCLALVRCGTAPTAGGGSDMPNGAVAQIYGYVAGPDSSPLAGADVYLRKFSISASGDSVHIERQTRSADDGWFGFDSAAPGAYAVFCQSADKRFAAVNQFLRVHATRDTVIGPTPLIMGPQVNLVGNIFLPPELGYSSVEIFIPGTGIGVRIKAAARRIRYLLGNAPPGRFDLAIVYGNVANFLPVNIYYGAEGRDVAVRDVAFAPLGIMADTALAPYPTTTERSYCITPQAYTAGLEPPWYWGVNFAEVDYYDHQSGVLTLWDADGPYAAAAYDTLIAGMAWREPDGRVMLETFTGNPWGRNVERWELRGAAVSAIDERKRAVLAAVIRRSNAVSKWLEVVDMEEYAQCQR